MDYGVIAVDVADYYIVQEYTSLNSKKKYFRISTDAGYKFQEWIEITQNN